MKDAMKDDMKDDVNDDMKDESEGSLENICCDALLDKLGEKPDCIQILVQGRALERIERTYQKRLRRQRRDLLKRGRANMLDEVRSCMTDLVPDILSMVIEANRGDALPDLAGMFPRVDSEILDLIRDVSIASVRVLRDELFFPPVDEQ